MLLVLHNQIGIFDRMWALIDGQKYQPETIDEEKLSLVAILEDSDQIDEAWNYSQNCWPSDNNPLIRLTPHRSTDVGDIIQTESGESYLVDSVSFTLLKKQPIYAHVSQVVEEPTGEFVEIFPTLNIPYLPDLPLIQTVEYPGTFYYLEIRGDSQKQYRLLRTYK